MMLNGNNIKTKLELLKNMLSEMKSVLIAYSGGVDSTFLLKVASDVPGNKTIAVTARAVTYPSAELSAARKNAKIMGIKHVVIDIEILKNKKFASNPPDRCYYCKKELFSRLSQLAKQYNLDYVVDGSNYDDLDDFRPGFKAAAEFGVRSPLKEVMLTKENIRILSKELNLPTWDKAAQACLSSRFQYGMRITKEDLVRLEKAEKFLLRYGVKQVRVRVHGDIARIEVPKSDMNILLNENIFEEIVRKFKEYKYTYVTLDIQGYRTGSMNESLSRRF